MTKEQAILELRSFDNINFNEAKARELTSEISNGLRLPESVKVEFERGMINVFKSTKVIAGELINVGRIIFVKLYNFIQENPNMVLGTIVGAVFGMFVGWVPLIGGILSLIATFLGAAIGGYLDYVNKGGRELNSTLEKAIAGATHTTKEFFKLLNEIFKALNGDM